MRRYKPQSPVEKLEESYMLLEWFVQNPKKLGYLLLLKRMRGKSKVPINLNMSEVKKEVDADIRDIVKKIRGKIGWYEDLPDGLKE
jgi:hypothetical protein